MRRHSEKAVPFPSVAAHRTSSFEGDHLGGNIMNTALARRLALGDRVIWMGKDDCQRSGPGTIIRITAHQVEVQWEDETARRYRRAQLHNLRHVKLISAAAEPRCQPLTASKVPVSWEFAWYVRQRNKIKYPVEIGP
jgi:hypothetical protein